MMKTISILLKNYWLAVLVLIFCIVGAVYSAPMPPRTLINHKTKQCAQITPGDECGDVLLPPDWEYLDASTGGKCPDDYSVIELHPEWTHFKTSFCCSEGHSGSQGDCQDVIVQQTSRLCAFVDDIQKCPSLPEGWDAWGKNCPTDFKWQDAIACKNAESSPAVNATGSAQTEAVPDHEPTATSSASQTQPTNMPSARNPLFPCGSVGLALIALIWLSLRRV